MGILLRSNLPLPEAVATAAETVESGVVRAELMEAAGRIESGTSLTTTLRDTGLGFPTVFEACIAAAELTGRPTRIFSYLSEILSRRRKIRRRLIEAMVYPAFVILLTLGECGFIRWYLHPPREGVTAPARRVLGPETETGIDDGGRRVRYLLACTIIGSALLGVCMARYRRWKNGESVGAYLSRQILRLMPPIRKFMIDYQLSVYCHAAGGMAECGLPTDRCFDLAGRAVTDPRIRTALETAHRSILNGSAPSNAFEDARILPATMVRWIRIGERTGNAVAMFGYLHTFFSRETERRFRIIEKSIEPVCLILAGCVVLVAVFTSILPLFASYWNIPV